jgi:hypothetical protein
VIFKEKFANWSTLPIMVAQPVVGRNVSQLKLESSSFDIKTLHKPPTKKQEVLIDNAEGDIKIWRIEGFDKVEVAASSYGHFFSGESYIILYKYIWKNKDCFIIYYYQGRDSSINEKGTSAMLTIEMDKQINGMAKEIRVVQFKEPLHFLLLFKRTVLYTLWLYLGVGCV